MMLEPKNSKNSVPYKIYLFAEKLRDEWELASPLEYRTSSGHISYLKDAYEVDLPYSQMAEWLRESGLEPRQLSTILERLKQEDLIIKYEILDPSR